MASRIGVDEAKAGMVLARPLIDGQGRVLVGKGMRISPVHISRMRRWGVTELFVEEPGRPAGASATMETGGSAVAAAGTVNAGGGTGDAGGLPPGVSGGTDLAERIAGTFAGVGDDPVMAGLREVVRRRLLDRPPAEAPGHGG